MTETVGASNDVFNFDGHYFKVIKNTYSYEKAKRYCEVAGGHLATITSQEKAEFLSTEVNPDHLDLWMDTKEDVDTTARKQYICEWEDLESAYCGLAGYRFYNGHTFQIIKQSQPVSWPAARLASRELGAFLASSTSSEKNEFLSLISDGRSPFIGASDVEQWGVWKWDTGEDWAWTNWYAGEPNNAGQGSYNAEPYLQLMGIDGWGQAGAGYWNDAMDGYTTSYLLEWPADLRLTGGIHAGNVLAIDNHPLLQITELGVLYLTIDDWGITSDIHTPLSPPVIVSPCKWHHILFRLSDSSITVWVDGELALTSGIPKVVDPITPTSFEVGGFVGYLDEFAVRTPARLGRPFVPTAAYGYGSAPISRTTFSASNLPNGLSISQQGVVTGSLSTTGTTVTAVTATTNYGSTTENIKIVSQ